MAKVFFKEFHQAVLFEAELKGQISDGHWSNATPFNHFEEPCNAQVMVDPKNPRVSKWSSKKYDFANSKLINIVGGRMIHYVKAAKLIDPEMDINRASFLVDNYLNIIKAYEGELPDENNFIAKSVKKYGVKLKEVKKIVEGINSVEYDRKDLRKDLVEMKKVWNK